MKCPNCSREASPDAVECAACGLVFDKWKKRKEFEDELSREEKARALAALESGAPPPVDSLTGRWIAAGIAVVWLVGFAAYFHRRYARASGGAPAVEFVERRDPETGEIRRLPIRRPASGAPGKR